MKKSKSPTHQIFKRIPRISDHDARVELGRAHLLIALLSFALLLTLLMGLQPDYVPNRDLTIVAVTLLVLVGLFSFVVAVSLYTKKK